MTSLSIVMIDMSLWCACLKRWTIGRLNEELGEKMLTLSSMETLIVQCNLKGS